HKLWNQLSFATALLDPQSQLTIDIQLTNRPQRDFSGATFESINLSGCPVPGDRQLVECTFSQSTFRNVHFDLSRISLVGFLGCTFYDCTVSGTSTEKACWVLGSREHGGNVVEFM